MSKKPIIEDLVSVVAKPTKKAVAKANLLLLLFYSSLQFFSTN